MAGSCKIDQQLFVAGTLDVLDLEGLAEGAFNWCSIITSEDEGLQLSSEEEGGSDKIVINPSGEITRVTKPLGEPETSTPIFYRCDPTKLETARGLLQKHERTITLPEGTEVFGFVNLGNSDTGEIIRGLDVRLPDGIIHSITVRDKQLQVKGRLILLSPSFQSVIEAQLAAPQTFSIMGKKVNVNPGLIRFYSDGSLQLFSFFDSRREYLELGSFSIKTYELLNDSIKMPIKIGLHPNGNLKVFKTAKPIDYNGIELPIGTTIVLRDDGKTIDSVYLHQDLSLNGVLYRRGTHIKISQDKMITELPR